MNLEKAGIKRSKAGKKLRMKFDGLIQPDFTGKHGIQIEEGIKYTITYSKKHIILLRIVKFIQKTLWYFGIAIHDPIFGECTPDFNCCIPTIGKYSFINIKKRGLKWAK